jgi:tyrosyl-tRNA synthetase
MDFVKELEWRGMIHDIMPGTTEQFNKEMTAAYVGFDPTADSLHIGHLVSIMLLKHLQLAGHKPIMLIGGATGMIGDPSGKSEERNLLSEEIIQHNVACVEKQFRKFLDFDSGENAAEIVNNYDWFKNMSFLDFIRDIGKHITVNYMMAKDSVKKRLETGISFTEFTYQLVQGYDFYHLYQHKNCRLQMGGSDQWGNIVTGTELIRRKCGGEAFALTCPLITKADGGKFGKTESGTVWLDPEKTSPYKFYQFWLNTSDEDAAKYLKIFTLLTQEEIEKYIISHQEAPHERVLQKTLAREMTVMVHSEEDYAHALEASNILFGKATADALKSLNENDFLDIFHGVPTAQFDKSKLVNGLNVVEILSEETSFLGSKGEARRALKENSISINKEKVDEAYLVDQNDLINGKYILLQRGKKQYFIAIASS